MTPAGCARSILIDPGREVPALATVAPQVRHAPSAIDQRQMRCSSCLRGSRSTRSGKVGNRTSRITSRAGPCGGPCGVEAAREPKWPGSTGGHITPANFRQVGSFDCRSFARTITTGQWNARAHVATAVPARAGRHLNRSRREVPTCETGGRSWMPALNGSSRRRWELADAMAA